MKAFSAIKYLPLVFIIFAVQLYGCGSCFHKERTSLLEIKEFFNTLLNAENSRDPILPSWTDDPNNNCCGWERVNCSAATGRVIELSLARLLPYTDPFPHRNLNLSLLRSFGELQSLDLSENSLTGFVDHIEGFNSFGRLKKLRTLTLTYNDFNNSILPFLSAATSLRTLYLESNSLEGVFPSKELANMMDLRVLKSSYNTFSFLSTQGAALANLRDLEVLELSDNTFNNFNAGQEFSNMTKLKTLDLSENWSLNWFHLLQGLTYLRELRALNLRFNGLSSSLPSQGGRTAEIGR